MKLEKYSYIDGYTMRIDNSFIRCFIIKKIPDKTEILSLFPDDFRREIEIGIMVLSKNLDKTICWIRSPDLHILDEITERMSINLKGTILSLPASKCLEIPFKEKIENITRRGGVLLIKCRDKERLCRIFTINLRNIFEIERIIDVIQKNKFLDLDTDLIFSLKICRGKLSFKRYYVGAFLIINGREKEELKKQEEILYEIFRDIEIVKVSRLFLLDVVKQILNWRIAYIPTNRLQIDKKRREEIRKQSKETEVKLHDEIIVWSYRRENDLEEILKLYSNLKKFVICRESISSAFMEMKSVRLSEQILDKVISSMNNCREMLDYLVMISTAYCFRNTDEVFLILRKQISRFMCTYTGDFSLSGFINHLRRNRDIVLLSEMLKFRISALLDWIDDLLDRLSTESYSVEDFEDILRRGGVFIIPRGIDSFERTILTLLFMKALSEIVEGRFVIIIDNVGGVLSLNRKLREIFLETLGDMSFKAKIVLLEKEQFLAFNQLFGLRERGFITPYRSSF